MRRSVPHILVSLICFGPLAFVVMLGVPMVPFWISMLVSGLPDTATAEEAASFWWSIGWVIGGVLGLFGVARILRAALQRKQISGSLKLTVSLLVVGAMALVSFNYVGGGIDLGSNLPGAMVYGILPAIGTVHLLLMAYTSIGKRSSSARDD